MDFILKNGRFSAAVRSLGGELISFKAADGTEYIWQGDPAWWPGRNPNLFPIIGTLKDGSISIDGAAYSMGRHGFARQSEFSLCDRGEDHVVLQLVDSASTLQQFPFPFRLRIRHQLLENGFFTQFEVTNTGESTLPFCIGAHPAFRCPLKPGERFEDCKLVFDQPEDTHALLPTSSGYLDREKRLDVLRGSDTLPLDHGLFERVDTLMFEGLKSGGVRLLGPDGHGVHMDFSQFPMLALWTNGAKQAPFLCVEPWHGCPACTDESGGFEDKPHAILLPPGETKTLRYTVTLV